MLDNNPFQRETLVQRTHQQIMRLSNVMRMVIIGEFLLTFGLAMLTKSVLGFLACILILGGMFLCINTLVAVLNRRGL